MGAADASLICLYIMTSPNMPKRVYLEEVIDRVVLFMKYQLLNTIFPSFDATYRLDSKKKDGRKKKNAPVSEKGVVVLYTKISELVNLLAELLNIQILTDTSVLHASSMGVSPFFAENVSQLQLACLKLVTTVRAWVIRSVLCLNLHCFRFSRVTKAIGGCCWMIYWPPLLVFRVRNAACAHTGSTAKNIFKC